MPEGHAVHRQAATFAREVGGRDLTVTSPQGRFADGAALLDGRRLAAAEAHGKHLFLGFAPAGHPGSPAGGAEFVEAELVETEAAGAEESAEPQSFVDPQALRWMHVHLGLYGKWWWQSAPDFVPAHPEITQRQAHLSLLERPGPGRGAGSHAATREEIVTDWQATEPRPTARVRLERDDWAAELTGPTRCEVLTLAEKRTIGARLGPDPLREDHRARGAKVFSDKVRSRRTSIAEQLMDQSVVAGVGNIYRAEVLFRARLDPWTPGRQVSARKAHAMWRDLVALMSDAVRIGAIITTEPSERPYGEEIGELAPAAERASEWEADQRFYVYKRTGRPCLRCGAHILDAGLAGRTLYWCPRCQRPRR